MTKDKRNYTYLNLLKEAIKDKFVGFTEIFETDRFIMLGISIAPIVSCQRVWHCKHMFLF